MTEPVSLVEANCMIAEVPRLGAACRSAFAGKRMSRDKRRVAQRCAAHLYQTEWLDVHHANCGGSHGGETGREELGRLKREAFRNCQAVGIIPGGIEGIILRFILMPFLEALIRRYVFDV
jgi:hypothetical protein